jgi:hypothetical protein
LDVRPFWEAPANRGPARRRPRYISAGSGALGELRQHRGWAANGSQYSVLKLTSNGAKCPDIIPPIYQSTLPATVCDAGRHLLAIRE